MLVDLACGELDEVRAAAVRKHCAGCAECGPALARLERGRSFSRALVREEPPSVSDALRDAIARAAAEYAKSPAVPAASAAAIPAENSSLSGDERGDQDARARRSSPTASVVRLVPRWLERVGAVAMRRQVAMAAVFLVTVGVGLAYYQTHPRVSQLVDARRPDVVPAQEVAAGPSTAPAGTAPPNAPTPTHRAAQSPNVFVAARPATARTDEPRVAAGSSNAGNGRPAPLPAPVAALRQAELERQQANVGAALAANDNSPGSEPAAPLEPRARNFEQRAAEEPASVARLRAALASATEPAERARIANELAVELQRLGRTREADQVVASANTANTANTANAPPTAAAPPVAAHENRAQAGRAANVGVVAASVDREPANTTVNSMPVIPRPARAPSRMARPRAASPGADMMDDVSNAYH